MKAWITATVALIAGIVICFGLFNFGAESTAPQNGPTLSEGARGLPSSNADQASDRLGAPSSRRTASNRELPTTPFEGSETPRPQPSTWLALRAALVDAISAKQRQKVDHLLDEIARFAVEERKLAFLQELVSSRKEDSWEVKESLHFALSRTKVPGIRTWCLERFSKPTVSGRLRIAALIGGIHECEDSSATMIYEFPYVDLEIPNPPSPGIEARVQSAIRGMHSDQFRNLQSKTNFAKALIPLVAAWIRTTDMQAKTWMDFLTDPELDEGAAWIWEVFRGHPLAPILFRKAMEMRGVRRHIALTSLPDKDNFGAFEDAVWEIFHSEKDGNLRPTALMVLDYAGAIPDARLVDLMKSRGGRSVGIHAAVALAKKDGAWADALFEHAFDPKASRSVRHVALKALGKRSNVGFRPTQEQFARFALDHAGQFANSTHRMKMIWAAERLGWTHVRETLMRVARDPAALPAVRSAADKVVQRMH